MGLELFSPDEERSAIVTAILTPDGVDAKRARARAARTLRDHGRRRPRGARVAHVPDRPHRLLRRARHHDRRSTAVETLLVERGAQIERGAAVARALEAYRRHRACLTDAARPRPRADRRRRPRASATSVRRRRGLRVGSRVDHRRLRRDRHPLGDDARRRRSSSERPAQGHRPGGRRGRQRRRRRRDPARDRRRERCRVDRRSPLPSTRSRFSSRSRATCRRRMRRSRPARGIVSASRGVELAGKTLGVLGLGRIGRQVARRALGLGMRVIAYDPFVAADRFRELGVEPAGIARRRCSSRRTSSRCTSR